MINYLSGDILQSNAQALVNTVNTVGVMGKGIALQFKKAFPYNYSAYSEACKKKEIQIGKLFVTKDSNLYSGEKIIINFPTKKSWRKPSEYDFIEEGLDDLVKIIHKYKIKSIAIPPLGAGNGGLSWIKVKQMLKEKLEMVNIDIYIYEPNFEIKESLKKERVKLTDARALLLYVLYDLVKNGEYVSEFSSEKVCYFLQKFSSQDIFKLKFTPSFYGPYSGKVRYILNILNGSYILGYSDMNKKPFSPLTLIADGYETVLNYINNDNSLKKAAIDTLKFLNGFYSDFALELISSIDYIVNENKTYDKEIVLQKLESWNNRKRSKFTNYRYIDIAINHLRNSKLSDAESIT